MVQSQFLKWTFSVVILYLFGTSIGCSQQKTVESVFPKTKANCESMINPRRYIARWENGSHSLILSHDRESLIKNFVSPNLKDLQLVEPDFRLQLYQPQSAGSIGFEETANNWGPQSIHADQAWKKGFRGQNITVAVIDTGLDVQHKQIFRQLALNTNEIPGNNTDDDFNGFIDDYAGFDFTTNKPLKLDYESHGTHVAGIIAAEHDDTIAGEESYVQGVAPAARILPLAFIDSSGGGSLYDAIKAIDYAVLRKANIINASWGGPSCSLLMQEQISSLYQKNIFFISAAGNSGIDIDQSPEFPAAFNLRPQITAGAIGEFKSRAMFSNYGDNSVHIFAPGVDIVSLAPRNRMIAMSGTSMAAPMLSGAIALLLSANPKLKIDEVRQLLYEGANKDMSYHNSSRGSLDLAPLFK